MPSEFPTFPAYRNLCGETREGEMPHILQVAAPGKWELCHMLCGQLGRGNNLLDDVCLHSNQGFWVPPAASAVLGPWVHREVGFWLRNKSKAWTYCHQRGANHAPDKGRDAGPGVWAVVQCR